MCERVREGACRPGEELMGRDVGACGQKEFQAGNSTSKGLEAGSSQVHSENENDFDWCWGSALRSGRAGLAGSRGRGPGVDVHSETAP